MQKIINNIHHEYAEFTELNRDEITQLATFAEISKGFTLAFAEMNFAPDLQMLLQALEEHRRCKNIQFVVIRIDDPELELVLSAIKEELQKVVLEPDKKPVLLVVGLERAIGYVDTGNTPDVIANLNFARNAFPKQLPYPVVFMLPDYALTRLARGAHDFWSWTSASFQFRSGRKTVEQAYQKTISENRLFTSDVKPVKQERIDLLNRLLMQYAPTTTKPDAETAPLRLNILQELADAYFSLSDTETAQQFYTEGLVLAQSIDKPWEQANALIGLGNISAFSGNSSEALNLCERALILYRAVDAPLGEANSLLVLGSILQLIGQKQGALDRYHEALQLYKIMNNPLGEANTSLAIGNILQFSEKHQEALNYYDSALNLYETVGDRLGEATTLKMIGDVLKFREHQQEALNLYDVALKHYQSIGNQFGEADTLKEIGDVLQFLKQSQEALNRYNKALELYKATGDHLGEANTLTAIGDALQFLDQRQEALNRYEEALELYKTVGARLGEANTLQAIGDVFLQQEDLDEEKFNQGYEYLNTAYSLYGEIDDRYSQARILLTSIIPVLRSQGEIEQAIASAQEAANLAEAIGYEPMQQHAAKFLAELTQS